MNKKQKIEQRILELNDVGIRLADLALDEDVACQIYAKPAIDNFELADWLIELILLREI